MIAFCCIPIGKKECRFSRALSHLPPGTESDSGNQYFNCKSIAKIEICN